MSRLLIICEGITDQVFIGYCVNTFWGLPIEKDINKKEKTIKSIKVGENCEIIGIGGCEKLKNKLVLDMLKDNTDEGGKNVVIFDADFAPDSEGEKQGNGNNGFKNATQKLESIKEHHEVDFDYYLWHNNSADGEIEHLLQQLIPQEKKVVMECIDNHHKCLVSTNLPGIKHADLKTRLSYYIYTMNHASDPLLRDYSIKELWELDHEKYRDLRTFKQFLEKYFAAMQKIGTTDLLIESEKEIVT